MDWKFKCLLIFSSICFVILGLTYFGIAIHFKIANSQLDTLSCRGIPFILSNYSSSNCYSRIIWKPGQGVEFFTDEPLGCGVTNLTRVCFREDGPPEEILFNDYTYLIIRNLGLSGIFSLITIFLCIFTIISIKRHKWKIEIEKKRADIKLGLLTFAMGFHHRLGANAKFHKIKNDKDLYDDNLLLLIRDYVGSDTNLQESKDEDNVVGLDINLEESEDEDVESDVNLRESEDESEESKEEDNVITIKIIPSSKIKGSIQESLMEKQGYKAFVNPPIQDIQIALDENQEVEMEYAFERLPEVLVREEDGKVIFGEDEVVFDKINIIGIQNETLLMTDNGEITALDWERVPIRFIKQEVVMPFQNTPLERLKNLLEEINKEGKTGLPVQIANYHPQKVFIREDGSVFSEEKGHEEVLFESDELLSITKTGNEDTIELKGGCVSYQHSLIRLPYFDDEPEDSYFLPKSD